MGVLKSRWFLFYLFILILLTISAVYACVTPTDGLVIENDTTFCGGTYFLNGTSDGSSTAGIRINTSNVRLDCNNTALVGNFDNSSEAIGITLTNTLTNVSLVNNCSFIDYNVGVFAGTSWNLLFEDLYFSSNVSLVNPQLQFSGGNNTIVRRNTFAAAAFGVGGSNTYNLTVQDSDFRVIRSSGVESPSFRNVVLLNNTFNTTFNSGGGASIDLTGSNFTIVNNTFFSDNSSGKGISISNAVRNNTIARNVFTSGEIGIELTGVNVTVRDNVMVGVADGIRVSGGNHSFITNRLLNSSNHSVILLGAGNYFINNTLTGSSTNVEIAGFGGGNNSILNSTGVSMNTTSGNNNRILWFIRVNVSYANGTFATSNITFYNRTSDNNLNATTSNATGITEFLTIREYAETSGTRHHDTNYTVNASDGFGMTGTATVNVTDSSQIVNIVLQNSTCLFPSDDLYINQDSVLCPGNYTINDSAANGLIIINASNVNLNCSAAFIVGNRSGTGILSSGHSNVTLSSCKFAEYQTGIHVASAENSTVLNANLTGNRVGLLWNGSSHSNITLNYFFRNNLSGMQLLGVVENLTIARNNFSNTNQFLSGTGLNASTEAASQLTLLSNNFSTNYYGLRLSGTGHTLTSNRFEVSSVGGLSSGEVVGFNFSTVTSTTFSSNTGSGIYLVAPTYNNTFSSGTYTSNAHGVLVANSSNNRFIAEVMVLSTAYGYGFSGNSTNNTVMNTTFAANGIDASTIHATANNIVLNSTSVATNGSAGILFVKWFARANVTNSDNTGAAVNVSFLNVTGTHRFNASTAATGLSGFFDIAQYYENGTGKMYENNYNATASNGTDFGYSTFNATASGQFVHITLDNTAGSPGGSCVTPYDDLEINTSTTLCGGTYQLNDSASDGLIKITNSSLTLDCNSTLLIGQYENTSQLGIVASETALSNITLSHCSLQFYYPGINFTFGSDLNIYNSSFNESHVVIANWTGSRFENNTFRNHANTSFFLSALRGTTNNSIFRANNFSDFINNSATSRRAIDLTGSISTVTIEENLFNGTGSGDFGDPRAVSGRGSNIYFLNNTAISASVSLQGSNVSFLTNTMLNASKLQSSHNPPVAVQTNWSVRDNTFEDNHDTVSGQISLRGEYLYIINNTIDGNQGPPVRPGGIDLTRNSNHSVIANNTIIEQGVGIALDSNAGLNLETDGTQPNNITIAHNRIINFTNVSLRVGLALRGTNVTVLNNSITGLDVNYTVWAADLNNSVIRDNSLDISSDYGVFSNGSGNVSFINNSFSHVTGVGARIFDSNNLFFVNNSFSNTTVGASTTGASENNTILNSSNVTTNGTGGLLYVQWFALFNTTYSNGTVAPNANVSVLNATLSNRVNSSTNASGFSGLSVVTEYYENGSGKRYETNLTANATLGSAYGATSFNISYSPLQVNILLNTAPPTPSLNLPENNTNFTAMSSVALNWSNVTDADADAITYIVQVANDSGFTATEYFNSSVAETANVTNVVATGLGAGAHYWRVLASDGTYNSSWSEVRFFNTTANTAPSVPTLHLPANQTAFSVNSFDLNWSNSTDADGDAITYIVEVSSSINFDSFAYSNTSVVEAANVTGVTLSSMSNGDYYWRVLATDGKDNSSYSTIRLLSVSVATPPTGGGGGCKHQCSTVGETICDGNGYRECGNFDSDSCREWSPITACSDGAVCSAGACVCQEVIICGPWSTCVGGVQSRVCQDTAECSGDNEPFTETQSCGISELPTEFPANERGAREHNITVCFESQGLSAREILNLEFLLDLDACTPGYGNVQAEPKCGGVSVDVAGEALLSFLFDGAKPSLFLSFDPSDLGGPYCPYCFDGVKNFDETDVDCGGPNCPLCEEKPSYLIRPPLTIPLLMIIVFVLSLAGIYLSGRYLKRVL